MKQIPNGIYPKINLAVSDTETTDAKSEDEEKKPVTRSVSLKGKASLWKKVSKNVEEKKIEVNK